MVAKNKKAVQKSIWVKIYDLAIKYIKGISAVIGFVVLMTGVFSNWFAGLHPPEMGSWVCENVNSARTNIATRYSGPATNSISCHKIFQIPDGYIIGKTPPVAVDGRIYFIIGKKVEEREIIEQGILVCVNADSGNLEWQFKPKTNDGLSDNSIIVFHNRKIILGNGTMLYMLDFVSGILLNQMTVADENDLLFTRIIKPIVYTDTIERWKSEDKYYIQTGYPNYIVSNHKLEAYLKTFDNEINLFNHGKVHMADMQPGFIQGDSSSWYSEIYKIIAGLRQNSSVNGCQYNLESIRSAFNRYEHLFEILGNSKDKKKVEVGLKKLTPFFKLLEYHLLNYDAGIEISLNKYIKNTHVPPGELARWDLFLEENCKVMAESVMLQDSIEAACRIKSIVCNDTEMYVLLSDGFIYCISTDTCESVWLSLAGYSFDYISKPSFRNNKIILAGKNQGKTNPFVVEFFTDENQTTVNLNGYEKSLGTNYGTGEICIGKNYSVFLMDNQLFVLDDANSLSVIPVPVKQTESKLYSLPIIDNKNCYVCYEDGLYGINLLDSSISWQYEWDVTYLNSKSPLIVSYNSKVLLLQNNSIRCFSTHPELKNGIKTSGECLWVKNANNLGSYVDDKKIQFGKQLIIFNSHIYVFGEEFVISYGDKKGDKTEEPEVVSINLWGDKK